jgi:predicted ATP-dependent serine protease
MKINLQSTLFTAVKDVQIPDAYFNRVKSGIPEVDEMFGGGMLPGSITTISSKAGVGKSTMVLQILNGMVKSGHTVGFVSAEESIHQVAFACRRLGISDVGICNESNLKKIIGFMDNVDVVVIDSFHAVDRGNMEEKHAIETLINKAKETECVVIIICHLTKGGVIKGNNLLTYAVDVNIFVELGETPDLRRIYFAKNRFGPGIDYTCAFTSHGYDFTPVTAAANEDTKKSKKTERKEKDREKILNMNGRFSVSDICDELDVDATRAGFILRELTLEGRLKKNNLRGNKCRWWVNKIEATLTKH